jgi:L-aminopeptidase/D-esterase-like protein
MSDGDTIFALATGAAGKTLGMVTLCTLAAEVTARAIVRAVRAAQGVSYNGNHWPAASELTS